MSHSREHDEAYYARMRRRPAIAIGVPFRRPYLGRITARYGIGMFDDYAGEARAGSGQRQHAGGWMHRYDEDYAERPRDRDRSD